MKCAVVIAIAALLSVNGVACAGDYASLCADRTAIERIYHQHRLGDKPPFEQVLTPATLENLVRQDLRKEAVLKKNYGVEITAPLLDAEVQRINTTTRAPEMLAEIKAALGQDLVRFANVFAKPILVERLLREKFDNDDILHAPQRREVEQVRSELLIAKTNSAGFVRLLASLQHGHSNEVKEMTWQLGVRPAETNPLPTDEIEIKKRFGPNAQLVSAPSTAEGKEPTLYFEDLPGELQNVLRVQLRQAGDVSAVIETPGGFLFYLARQKTDAELSVAVLSVPKRSYEQWLAGQNETMP